ncbi:MAG: Amino acid ABC transporter, ATP-binding protein [candidate division TM6 bacterium GW2011_GWF2_37_49]|nr:MAG: Amino acid ABC transporter, ATP-binding protein [candidate division TM6 bacterium GW2011_GWF2_37_49]
MIKVQNLSVKISSGQQILNNVSCLAPAGRITTLIGKSGSGKTTLLRTIARLNTFECQGKIEIDGKNIVALGSVEQASLLGFVFQDFNLFENMTVLENCIQPLIVVKKLSAQAAKEIALEKLSSLGMGNFLSAYHKSLSGGQKQRIAIARALCMGSKTLLLDEPTSALDPENTTNLVALLKGLCAQGIAILISSQDMTFVKMILDRVYLVDEGKITDFFDLNESAELLEDSRMYKFLNF